jgi:hypothetical protein
VHTCRLTKSATPEISTPKSELVPLIDRAAAYIRHQIWCSTVMVPHQKRRCNCGLRAFMMDLADREGEIDRLRSELAKEFQRRNLIEESIAQQLTPDEASKAWNAVVTYAPATNPETSHHYDSVREKLDATRHSDHRDVR